MNLLSFADWFRKKNRPYANPRKARPTFLRPLVEVLEDRIMLDAGLPSALVVGRTLSSYFVGGVQNQQETITYTVYNNQAPMIVDVLLTDTLAPGVTVVSAPQQPDQHGQQVAWSLGTILTDSWATVSLTVSVPNSQLAAAQPQLDGGARAFGTLNGSPVANSAPAATLRQGSANPNLLASTPDANITDPYIQEEAAVLDYNSQNIFNFLHTDIAYNSYTGSVRGARGTLWSDAGNALDVASLGVALMRASGIPAQYIAGTLSQSQAQGLILSMFPASDQTVGYIPAGTQLSNPANDSQLLSETENHYWFQFDAGNGMKDADPLMTGTISQAVTTPTASAFAQVPDSLREKTEIALSAEFYSAASAAFGLSGFSTTTVLDQTFNDVDLVGRPLSIGNFVSSSGVGALVFSSVTNTYTPYLAVGDAANPDFLQNQIITGQPYQETLTNFPLGNQILTGLFLNVTLSGPEGASETYGRTLVDRIGFANRQNGTIGNLSVNPQGPPIISSADIYTLGIQASAGPAFPGALGAEAVDLETQLTTIQSEESTDPAQAGTDLASANAAYTQIALQGLLTFSNAVTASLAQSSLVAAYYDRPRIVMVSNTGVENSQSQATTTFAIDLVRDTLRVIAAPNQSVAEVKNFQVLRGVAESFVETNTPQMLFGVNPPGAGSMSAPLVFQAAQTQKIPLLLINQATLGQLAALNFSAEAKARITLAVNEGDVVLVPAENVPVQGVATLAWYQINPNTGETIGVGQNGGNTLSEFLAENWLAVLSITVVAGLGILAAIVNAMKPFQPAPVQPGSGGFGPTQHIPYDPNAESLPFFLQEIQASLASGASTQTSGLSDLGQGVAALLGQAIDAPISAVPSVIPLSNPNPSLPFGLNEPSINTSIAPMLNAGPTSANLHMPSLTIGGQLSASWTGQSTGSFLITSLLASSASVRNANGTLVGSGKLALASPVARPIAISGNVSYALTGNGGFSAYDSATANLGISANWLSYAATLSGSIVLQVTTAALQLNGSTLPAGTYTITGASASLAGNGLSNCADFSGTLHVQATNGTVYTSAGSGSAQVASTPLDPTNAFTLVGYSGTASIVAGPTSEAVTLSGATAQVLTLSATPTAVTTNENTPVTLALSVKTSVADTYHISPTAPPGWTVSLNSANQITVTPAPGLQGGTYPITIHAFSMSNTYLVAQTTVNVTITPTTPGIGFNVVPDPLLTVPFNGAQVPSAFRAQIQNLGPAADSYTLAFSNLPSGFTILNSGTSVTVPAGQTGILGIYLQPNSGPLPPPGTMVSFTVTATSTSNPAISRTQTVNFTVPAIDALTVTSKPVALSTTPGAAVTDAITITNVGNVAESNIALASTMSSGLSLTGLHTLTLGVGQSATETITLTPSASTPLNSDLQATITATFGPLASPVTQTLQLPVDVVVPGAQAIAAGAIAAGQVGNTNLANRLNDLSTALTNLVQNPTSAVFSSQAQASLSVIVGLLSADAFLSPLAPALTSDATALSRAVTASAVQAAVVQLGNDLTTLGTTLADEAAHGFTLSLPANSGVALPSTPADFAVVLQNNGTQATTYDLGVAGLPAGVTAVFLQNNLAITSVTLQPGQVSSSGTIAITLQLTETGGSLFPTGFTVTASAEGAPEITQAAPGTLTVRAAVVDVTEVDATPPYTNPGSPVDVTAKVLNSVNQQQQALASYTVTDPTGTVVFTSTSAALTLNVQTSLITVDLGSFPTTSLANGSYTINVTVTDASGKPIPGATGQGSVLIGTPVSGSLTVSPTILPPGNGTVTNTLQINSQTAPIGPLSVVGQVALPGVGTTDGAGVPVGGGVALNGNLLYVSASDGVRVYDVTDPSAPKLLTTVGMSESVLRMSGNELIGLQNNASSWIISVYSLTDPSNPVLLGSTPAIPYYNLSQDFIVTGTHVFVPVQQVTFFVAGHDIFAQDGDLISVDISNPAAPHMDGVLLNTHGTDNDGIDAGSGFDLSGGNFIMWSVVQVDPTTLLVASTTATGGDTQDGVGRIDVVDISDPTHMAIVGHLDIPGTVQVTGLQLVGNQVLVTASTGGYQQNFGANYGLTGDVVLATLDVTAPRNPQLLHTQVVNRASRSDAVSQSRFASLGNGLYAFSNLGATTDKPELLVINAADPQNFGTGSTDVPSDITDLTGAGNYIYTTSADGLIIYQIAVPPPDLVTAQVQVPKNTVVAASFNIAPTQIITSDANFDTLEWDLSLPGGGSQTLTWQSTVTGLQAGQTQTVAEGATISFTSQGTPGTVTLPPTMVTGAQILGLSPASRTVAPAASASYTVTVTNPTNSSDTFNLAVLGVPAGWVSLPASVTVAAKSSVTETLTLTSTAFAALGDYGFTITANDANGAQASVSGDLILAGQPPVPDPNAHGVVVTLTPSLATVGQGTSAVYTVQVTNTGSAQDTYTLSTSVLPAHVTAAFSQTTITVPPGATNFKDVTLVLTEATGAAPGNDAFQVIANSTINRGITASAQATLKVVSQGVQVSLAPTTGAPGSTYHLTVKNTGTGTDTFDLSLAGPAALVATLAAAKVTLAAGASTTVTITTTAVNFAVQGALYLIGIAKSEANPAVQANAISSLQIPATKGLSAQFSPGVQVIAIPGTSNFLLIVTNTGNTEDAYSAVITGTSGPVTASLLGLNNVPANQIPTFRLPALSTGELLLETDLSAVGTGTITVQIQSLTTPALKATAIATVSAPPPPAKGRRFGPS